MTYMVQNDKRLKTAMLQSTNQIEFEKVAFRNPQLA
jgi:hypothetical protein